MLSPCLSTFTFYLDTYLNSVFWKTCMRRRQSLDSTRFSLYFCVILTDTRKSEIGLDNMLFNLKDPFRCMGVSYAVNIYIHLKRQRGILITLLSFGLVSGSKGD